MTTPPLVSSSGSPIAAGPARAGAAPAPPPLIELAGLSKRYGEITALADVNARVDGRIIGLLGPNGSGKSTLLKCLLGLIPFDGHAAVLGLSARSDGAAIRDRVGYMPENEAMLLGMSAVELCTYAGELSGLPRTEAMQRAHSALYYAGLEDKRYQPIDGYSTGMKQRVKLAQALVHDPELLFLDEPTNGLDPRSREEMLTLIRELPARRGCAIVLSTHLLPDVERMCDQVIIMYTGTMLFSGGVDELRKNHDSEGELEIEVKAHPERLVAELAAAGARGEVASALTAHVTLPVGTDSRLAFAAARRAEVQIRRLALRRDSLEAAFVRVISEADVAGEAGSAAGARRADAIASTTEALR